jgi:hypothetical protein
MEQFIVQTLVGAQGSVPEGCGCLSSLWHWGYWIAFFLGIAGFIVMFFMNPTDGN